MKAAKRIDLKVFIKRKRIYDHVWSVRLIMVIISQYTQIVNHYILLLKIICYFSVIPQSKKKKNRKDSKISLTEMHYPSTEENSEKVRTVFRGQKANSCKWLSGVW